jgi:hypothetical protein
MEQILNCFLILSKGILIKLKLDRRLRISMMLNQLLNWDKIKE